MLVVMTNLRLYASLLYVCTIITIIQYVDSQYTLSAYEIVVAFIESFLYGGGKDQGLRIESFMDHVLGYVSDHAVWTRVGLASVSHLRVRRKQRDATAAVLAATASLTSSAGFSFSYLAQQAASSSSAIPQPPSSSTTPPEALSPSSSSPTTSFNNAPSTPPNNTSSVPSYLHHHDRLSHETSTTLTSSSASSLLSPETVTLFEREAHDYFKKPKRESPIDCLERFIMRRLFDMYVSSISRGNPLAHYLALLEHSHG